MGLVAALFATTTLNSTARAQTAAPTHVAVINLQKVYSSLAETKDWQSHLQGLQGELKTMQDSHQAQLKELQDKISNTVKNNSDAYKNAMDDLDTKSLQFSLDEQTMKVKMAREANRQLKNTFDEINSTVADIAKKEGLDLVLVASNPELPNNVADTVDFEHLAQALFSRNVVYVADKIDVTADVIANLDAAYKTRK
jgi:Skp family chaperone for outer membrane proteins